MPANLFRIFNIDFSNRNSIATVAVCYPKLSAWSSARASAAYRCGRIFSVRGASRGWISPRVNDIDFAAWRGDAESGVAEPCDFVSSRLKHEELPPAKSALVRVQDHVKGLLENGTRARAGEGAEDSAVARVEDRLRHRAGPTGIPPGGEAHT